MENHCPYLRQRPDSYWEIVYRDDGKLRRKSAKTTDKFDAEAALAAFDPAEKAPDDTPRLRRRKDGYWETVWKEDGRLRNKAHGTRAETDGGAAHAAFLAQLAKPEVPARPTGAWVLDRYYSYICAEKSEATSGPMAAKIAPLKEGLGHLFWEEALQDAVDEYIQWRMERPRWSSHSDYDGQYGTTSRNTACKDLRVLRAA